MSAFDDFSKLPPLQIWDGVTGRVVEGERVTMALVELEPDTLVPRHSHENEQLGFVVRGDIGVTVGDDTTELRSGGTYRIAANVPHVFEAGPNGAVVVDVFAPVRADWKHLERLAPRDPRWP